MSAKPLIIGLSGPSSCGKTTLARLLTRIFAHSSILHADDFYLTDSQIPIHNGIQDWDCAEAIDVAKLVAALKRLKAGETVEAVRDGVASTEIPEAEGAKSAVNEEVLNRLRRELMAWEADMRLNEQAWERPPLLLIDGFLLFGETVSKIREQLDIKILLRSTYEDSKQRRSDRKGIYITHEGYWEDPPGYFDQIVWPNYVKNHKFLFHNDNTEGPVDDEISKSLDIDVVPGMGMKTLEETLLWVVELLKRKMAATM
ncbi:MAG: hypothetical protein Q9195_000628 [Heterodermia aff. obscurata]